MSPFSRTRLLRLGLLALVLAQPVPSRALFGVGDIVFDPSNTAQTINVLHEAEQEYDRLGSLLGVSTQQFDQLVQLATALGNAAESQPFQLSIAPSRLETAISAIPGLEGADLSGLFNSNGLLDAFLGIAPDQWAQAVENPVSFYRNALVNAAIARVGGSAGLSSPAIAYAQWYAARAPEDQYNLGPAATVDIANLLTEDWLGGARKRRVNLDGLAAASRDAEDKAGRAQTLVDQQHAQTQLGGDTNSILLESAAQNADAAEASVRAEAAQDQMLADQNETRRNSEEMRLNAPP